MKRVFDIVREDTFLKQIFFIFEFLEKKEILDFLFLFFEKGKGKGFLKSILKRRKKLKKWFLEIGFIF